MLSGDRSDRVGDQILRELSYLLIQKINDPRLQGVTLTEVKMTKDLRIAYVYFSFVGPEEYLKEIREGFKSAKGFIRKEIARCLSLRYVPDIQFRHDNSLEYGQKIDKLLDSVHLQSDDL